MSTQNGKPLPAVTFSHFKSIGVPASHLAVQFGAVSIDPGFSLPLEDLTEQYLTRKYVLEGAEGRFDANVSLLEVVKEYEPATSAFNRKLGVGGRDVYNMRLEVQFSFFDPALRLNKDFEIKVSRVLAISEHASIAERELAQMGAVEDLFKDFHLRAYSALQY